MKLPDNPTEAQILAVTGLVIKSIYTRGTVAVQTLDLDSQGRLTGIFLGDGVRFRYTIDNGILSYAPVNPKDLPSEEGISLSEDALEFARLKMAGNTKQEKKCKVGYPCGFTCISQSKVCNKALPHQAKNGSEWVKMQREKEGGSEGRKLISTADAASVLAEAVNGRLWKKKEGEIRIYVNGTNNGYLRIAPETDATSQVQYFMKSYDIPKVEKAVEAFNRKYQVAAIEDSKPKKRVLEQENEDGVIAPAGQHESGVQIVREWYK